MKRFLCLMLALILAFSLFACKSGGEEEERLPPAFGILSKQLTLRKYAESGKYVGFTGEEFERLYGTDVESITISALPEESAGRLIFGGAAVLTGQCLPAEKLGFLRFAPADGAKSASFCFTGQARGFAGREISCVIDIGTGTNLAPAAADGGTETASGIPVFGRLDVTDPEGDALEFSVVSYPRGGELRLKSDGSYVYYPKADYDGSDTLVYTATDKYGNASRTAKLDISVRENPTGLYFADMADDAAHYAAYRMCSANVMTYRRESGSYYFDPDTPVSRAEYLVMIMTVCGADTALTAVADSAASDDGGLSSGIKGYITAAAEKGIIRLENGKFRPYDTVTASEAAFTAARLLSLAGEDTLAAAISSGVVSAGTDGGKKLTKRDIADILASAADYITQSGLQNGGAA